MIYLKRLLYFFCTSCRPNSSRTVRYAFPVMFAAFVIFGAAALTSDSSSYIRIATDNSSVQANEQFSINVYAGAHVPVNAVDIALSFPGSQIKVEGIDTGESVITLWTVDPYVENDTVVLRGGTFRKGFLGEHLIATINARAKQAGVAKFTVNDIRLLAGDGKGSTVTIKDTGYESLTMYIGVENTEKTNSLNLNVKVGLYTDIDGDGDVDMSDVLSFMEAWRTKSVKFDFNNDGKMSFVDFAIILADSFFR